ncbi:hypothetical protein GQR58_026569 [Nymphon striatum]|nr:hypothetical protein GQR58_026569 [Nymphon striatum]
MFDQEGLSQVQHPRLDIKLRSKHQCPHFTTFKLRAYGELNSPIWNCLLVHFSVIFDKIQIKSSSEKMAFVGHVLRKDNLEKYLLTGASTEVKMKMFIFLRVVILMFCRYCGAVRRHLEDTDVDRAI